MPHSVISKVTNLTNAITNPARGDCIFLDLDKTLLLNHLKKYQFKPSLIEQEIVATIKMLRERGIKVIALTARKQKYSKITLEQLRDLEIEFDGVIHAESKKNETQKWQALRTYIETHQHEIKGGQLKRIFVFDDRLDQLTKINQRCQNLGVPIFLKHFITPQYLSTAEQAFTFPETLDDFTEYEELAGGTHSVFKIKNQITQQKLVLKFGAHENAGKLEILCNALYEMMGVKVPAMRIYTSIPKKLAGGLKLEKQYGKFKVCEFVTEAKNMSHEERGTRVRMAAKQHFIAHVIMGNIDIAKQDNFIVNEQGHVYMIDAGANFLFRSLGSHRKENPSLASEVDSLRDPSINARGARWFGHLTNNELSLQLDVILEKLPEIESLVWNLSLQLQLPHDLRDQLLHSLSDRFDILKTRFQNKPQRYAKVDKKAYEKTTAAGVLIYQNKKDGIHILLSKRFRHWWWDNLGGKSEQGDESLAATAAREVSEESNSQINYTEWELLNSPSHDIVTGEGKSKFVYRMYISPYSEIHLSKLVDHEHTAHAWVPLNALIKAVESNERIELENIKTGVVHYEGQIPIYPPLFKMLQQQAVMDILKKLSCGEKIKRTTTLSHADSKNQTEDLTHPLITPKQKRHELATNQMIKSNVLSELKKSQHFQNQIACGKSTPPLFSQTELYLKAYLKDDYLEGNVEANVQAFISHHYKITSNDKRRKLIDECVKFIENEKQQGHEYFYTYHGVNNVIAFTYDVYTALYSTLQANKNWPALRDNNQFLKRFANITEFIAYFSENGTKKIYNNDDHYNDCAIAANVFLFGCHNVESSSSIHYMIKNTINRSIDLPALLNNIFKPFNVTTEEINRLISVYKKYAKNQSGRLYQIGIKHDDIRLMSYAAKSGGRVLSFQGSYDLIDILEKLTANISSLSENLDYISELQARVMLPPSLHLQTNIFTWEKLPEDQLKAYHTTLKYIADAMVYKMLNHSSATQKSGPRQGALLMAAPHILQANDLTFQNSSPETEIMAAIQLNNERMVRELIQRFPKLLFKKVYQPKSVIRSYYTSHHQDSVTIANYILKQSKLNLAGIFDFNHDNWLNLFQGLEFDELIDALQRIPENHRIKLVMEYQELIFIVTYRAYEIIDSLPPEDKLKFAQVCLKNIHSDKTILNLAEKLLPEQRISFVSANLFFFTELIYLLKLIESEPDRVELITLHSNLITSSDNLKQILLLIPIELRGGVVDCVLGNHEVVNCMLGNNTVKNYLFDKAILELLPKQSRLLYAKTYSSKFSTVNLTSFLEILSDGSERNEYANHMFDAIRNGPCNIITKVISLLAPDDRVTFVNRMGEVTDTQLYFSILKLIKPEARLDFAISNQHHGHHHAFLSKTLKALGNDAYYFLNQYEHKISIYDNDALKKYIPDSQLYQYMLTRVHDENALKLLLSVAPISLRLGLTKQYQSLVAGFNLEYIVLLLPQKYRFEFATEMQHVITTNNFYAGFLEIFDNEDERLAFAMANRHKITACYNLSAITSLLPVNKRLGFKKLCVNNSHLFLNIIADLPAFEVFPFAMQYKYLVLTSYDLNRILGLINDEKQRREFLHATDGQINDNTALQRTMLFITATEQLPYVLRNLKDGYGLGVLLQLLPKNETVITINKYKHLIQDDRQLTHIINFLPREMKKNFVRENLHLIDSYTSLLKLSGFFLQNELLQLILTHQQKIKNNPGIEKVIFYLMQQNFTKSDLNLLFQILVSHFKPRNKPLSYWIFKKEVTNILSDVAIKVEEHQYSIHASSFNFFGGTLSTNRRILSENRLDSLLEQLLEIAKTDDSVAKDVSDLHYDPYINIDFVRMQEILDNRSGNPFFKM